jgi:hypothetical protein
MTPNLLEDGDLLSVVLTAGTVAVRMVPPAAKSCNLGSVQFGKGTAALVIVIMLDRPDAFTKT